jgi:hypothetical protein
MSAKKIPAAPPPKCFEEEQERCQAVDATWMTKTKTKPTSKGSPVTKSFNQVKQWDSEKLRLVVLVLEAAVERRRAVLDVTSSSEPDDDKVFGSPSHPGK